VISGRKTGVDGADLRFSVVSQLSVTCGRYFLRRTSSAPHRAAEYSKLVQWYVPYPTHPANTGISTPVHLSFMTLPMLLRAVSAHVPIRVFGFCSVCVYVSTIGVIH
jgi:hypothetical protein